MADRPWKPVSSTVPHSRVLSSYFFSVLLTIDSSERIKHIPFLAEEEMVRRKAVRKSRTNIS